MTHLRLLAICCCAAALLACGGGPQPTPPRPSPRPTAPVPTMSLSGAAEYEAGQTADVDGLRVTVSGARAISGAGAMAPPEGERFIAVDVAVENRTGERYDLRPLQQTDLVDGGGFAHPLDARATALAGGQRLEGPIAPGATLRGTLGYAVPDGARGLRWAFRDGRGTTRAAFDIAP